jgi:hypothetical protein
MTSTTAPVAVLHSTSPATDTARVWVDSAEPDRAAIAAARKIACGALHTIVGKPLTVESAGDGASYVTFPAIRSRRTTTPEVITDPAPAPVKAGKGKGKPAPTALDDAVGAAAFRAAVESPDVETLKRELDRITALLAAVTGTAPAPVKAPRAVPEFIARAQSVTCRTCRDLKVVRGVGAKAGQPYRTQAGADAATAAGRSVKCPSHKRASKSA